MVGLMKKENTKIKSARGLSVEIYGFWNLLFWDYCQKCRKEFVREGGWRYCERSFRSYERIVCKKCCPIKEDVLQYFKKVDETFMASRPTPSSQGTKFKRKRKNVKKHIDLDLK
jgi:hypothetical protein